MAQKHTFTIVEDPMELSFEQMSKLSQIEETKLPQYVKSLGWKVSQTTNKLKNWNISWNPTIHRSTTKKIKLYYYLTSNTAKHIIAELMESKMIQDYIINNVEIESKIDTMDEMDINGTSMHNVQIENDKDDLINIDVMNQMDANLENTMANMDNMDDMNDMDDMEQLNEEKKDEERTDDTHLEFDNANDRDLELNGSNKIDLEMDVLNDIDLELIEEDIFYTESEILERRELFENGDHDLFTETFDFELENQAAGRPLIHNDVFLEIFDDGDTVRDWDEYGILREENYND